MKELIFAIVLVNASGTAQAADNTPKLNYTFTQIGYNYLSLNSSGIVVDLNGPNLAASFEIGENYFIKAEYDLLEGEVFGTNVDSTETQIGFGAAWGLSQRTDIVVSVHYIDRFQEIQNIQTLDDNGFGVSLGMRGKLYESLELFGFLTQVNLSNSEVRTEIGARYIVSEPFSILIEYHAADDVDGFLVGARFDF